MNVVWSHLNSSDFGAEGEALASAWEPANPHDEALLIATVPKLHGKSTPMYAGGKPPAQPWCGATLAPGFRVAALDLVCLSRWHSELILTCAAKFLYV